MKLCLSDLGAGDGAAVVAEGVAVHDLLGVSPLEVVTAGEGKGGDAFHNLLDLAGGRVLLELVEAL